MKKAVAVFLIALCNSCYHSHNYPDGNNRSAYDFCKTFIVSSYRNVMNDFTLFINNKDNPSYINNEFIQVNDTCWRTSDDVFAYEKGVMLTIGMDSTVSYHQDVFICEDEYDSHIFTLPDGIRNGNGSIRLEVTLDGADYGWCQINFSDGEPEIESGK